MGGSKKEPQEWLPMYFDHYKSNDATPISDEEIEDIQQMMQQINEKSGK